MSTTKIIGSSMSLSELMNSLNTVVNAELTTYKRVINTNYTFG